MNGSQSKQSPQKLAPTKSAGPLIGIGQEKLKKCSKCGEVKPFSEFYKRKENLDGHRGHCKKCVLLMSNAYVDKNKEKVKERQIRYSEKNKKKIKNYAIKYSKENKFKISEYGKGYYIKNRDSKLAKCKTYSENNKEKISERHKIYRENNKEKIKKYHYDYELKNKDKISASRKKYKTKNKLKITEYTRNNKEKTNLQRRIRLKNNASYRLACSVRTRLCSAIRSQKSKKSGSMEILLGCTIKELKLYLENKFTVGMTWDNHSKKGWHIDHIKPCASFDLNDPEQQKICFSYKNLQPLWAFDNLSKGAKYASTS